MPSKNPAAVFCDIAREIALARSFVEAMTAAEFRRDRRTVYAVTRCLEIISEASRRIPKDVQKRHPQVPWANVAGAGNVYRHDYEDVADQLIWWTVKNGLGPLLFAVEHEMGRTSAAYRLLRRAILEEKQVTCVYQGLHREICPHIIGRTNEAERLLCYQFGGQSKGSRLPQWRCLFIAEVRDVRLRDGEWYEGSAHRAKQTCVTDVDLDINIHVRRRRNA